MVIIMMMMMIIIIIIIMIIIIIVIKEYKSKFFHIAFQYIKKLYKGWSNICDALLNLEKREKHLRRSVTFSKVAGISGPIAGFRF